MHTDYSELNCPQAIYGDGKVVKMDTFFLLLFLFTQHLKGVIFYDNQSNHFIRDRKTNIGAKKKRKKKPRRSRTGTHGMNPTGSRAAHNRVWHATWQQGSPNLIGLLCLKQRCSLWNNRRWSLAASGYIERNGTIQPEKTVLVNKEISCCCCFHSACEEQNGRTATGYCIDSK